eukprot:SAG22_NODE_9892_length_564_cov_1.507527_2_plen_69_part_00
MLPLPFLSKTAPFRVVCLPSKAAAAVAADRAAAARYGGQGLLAEMLLARAEETAQEIEEAKESEVTGE